MIDIRTMEAGQEMDLLVGVRVLGWKHHPSTLQHLPQFSTDAAAAMRVVDHMGRRGYSITLSKHPETSWRVEMQYCHAEDPSPSPESHWGTGETLALAVCQAALDANA